ncbi:MAG: hypothetical protein HRU70_14595 [Phycisphaeraceae bacterium]|nr:MAG: hypothetical protein HRU70_14595 [Phycisphaeraceae bacterium]
MPLASTDPPAGVRRLGGDDRAVSDVRGYRTLALGAGVVRAGLGAKDHA